MNTIARDVRPDIIQGWMYHGNLAASLAHTLTSQSGKLFWGIRCSDMDLSDYSMQLRLIVKLGAWTSTGPDIVIANSQAGADVHRVMGYTPRRMEVIANGIDIERFRPDEITRQQIRLELGISPEQKVAMHVARVDPMKDHASLLTALSRVPDIVGVLIGAGTEQLDLPPSVKALGRRSDVARLLTAGDIIVSSSAFGEGFPNGLAEGMSCGLVPVVTDVGDSRLIVGDTGTIVPRSDPEALASALSSLLAWPETRWDEARQSARRRITEFFTLDTASSRFASIYGMAP
ncbi:glycosyltransferase [Tardiphaga alba]|uniref:glycosyltransferase n=1 Tax=Tardiphaga alba TaxID=340268 RepID=UPI001BAC5DA5|nr:glycosyltransferase [Tardiphaga alba]